MSEIPEWVDNLRDELTDAKAENARLRSALQACPPTSNPNVSAHEHLERVNAWWRLIARPALKGDAP